MKKKFMKSMMVMMFLILITLSSCIKDKIDEEDPNYIDLPSEKMNYEVSKDQFFDAEGNLLVPYDIAYRHQFLNGDLKYDDHTILIKLSNEISGLTKAMKDAGLSNLELTIQGQYSSWYKVAVTQDQDIHDIMKEIRQLDDILVADYNYIYETKAITGYPDLSQNPRIDEQWYLNGYGIPEAWTWLDENGYSAGGSSSVVVAVIDTGVDYEHKDLAANMWINTDEIPGNNIDDDNNGYVDDIHGVNVISDDRFHSGNPMDDHGHGTHVAGIIAAANNKEGIVGVAYNSKIMAIKAGQASGYFTQADIAEAILYAYDNGADVINMSFGGTGMSIAVQDALRTAYTRSVLVASAGNSGAINEGMFAIPNYPAAYSYVIGVMSVNTQGVESVFTNYDARLYNSVEYEVYAPGENILSTLPNDNYASWSGTSMAAPVVSGIAALIRSAYTDRDMYPNKFIMGQITATSETDAICLSTQLHGIHNVPMIVDANLALTKMPKPDVSLYDYYVFDSETIDVANNGDGIIDAGETVDLGLVLRNRWGMSENTIVSIDSISSGGVANPFITFLTNDINYGGVGTYSTKDLLTRNDQFIVGVDDPFRIKIDDNTPNDYIIRINIHATMGNALDETDTNTYHFPAGTSIELVVRNGMILPNIIDTDMTLTKDNYYIIPNATIITEGTTVTVEPGTQIQFWTDDPNDAYADTAITYLKVEGSFITQGTLEEPVRLFPSELMSRYRVEIYESKNGYVSLENTIISNPYLNISYANKVEFKQNYLDSLYYRYLDSGIVKSSYTNMLLSIDEVNNSIFYALGSTYKWNKPYINSNVYNSIFVNSSVSFSTDYTYENNVFLKNNSLDYGSELSSNVTLNSSNKFEIKHTLYNSITGKTYIVLGFNQYNSENATYTEYFNSVRRYAQYLGGDLLTIDSIEEQNYLRQNLSGYYPFITGLFRDGDGSYRWVNGNEVKDIFTLDYDQYGYVPMDSSFNKNYEYDHVNYMILEVANSIYVDNIYLNEYSTDIDLESNYQINATVTPNTLVDEELIYISDDEGVATVNETGLISPVSYGTAKIYVYSKDYQKETVFTVNVVEKISIVNIDAYLNNYQLEVNTTSRIKIDYEPINTTQKELVYSSNNIDVAEVDYLGNITALSVGTATITVSSSIDGTIYDEFVVNVVNPATSIGFEESTYVTDLTSTNDEITPLILPLDATNKNVVWETSNPEVAYVDELGNLVKLAEGVATLRATIENTNLSAELIVSINNSYMPGEIIKMQQRNGYYVALHSDGNLYYWGKEVMSPKVFDLLYDVKDFAFFENYLYVLNTDGIVQTYYNYRYSDSFNISSTISETLEINNISKIESDINGYNIFILKTDGSVWGRGNNEYGQLGDGTSTNRNTFVQVMVNNVTDLAVGYRFSMYLTLNGDLYFSGSINYATSTPTKIDSGIISIKDISGDYISTFNGTEVKTYYTYSSFPNPSFIKAHSDHFYVYYADSRVYINDGEVITIGNNRYGRLGTNLSSEYYYSYEKMHKVENAKEIFMFENNIFIQTNDNNFFGTGKNSAYELGNLTTVNSLVPTQIFFGIKGNSSGFIVEDINIINNILYSDVITVDFSEAILTGENYPYIYIKDSTNKQLAILKEMNLDKLNIALFDDWIVGETYTLSVPASALTTKFMVSNTNIQYTFTYMGEQTPIELISSSINDGYAFNNNNVDITIDYTYANQGSDFSNILVQDEFGVIVEGLSISLQDNRLKIEGTIDFGIYKLIIPANALSDNMGGSNSYYELNFSVEQVLKIISATHPDQAQRKLVSDSIVIEFNQANQSTNFASIGLYDELNQMIETNITLVDNILTIDPINDLNTNSKYYVLIPEDAIIDNLGNYNSLINNEFTTYAQLELIRTSVPNLETNVNPQQEIRFFFNFAVESTSFEDIVVTDSTGSVNSSFVILSNNVLSVFSNGSIDQTYTITIPAGALKDELGFENELIELTYSTLLDIDRFYYTVDYLDNEYNYYLQEGLFTNFYNNAILNNLNDTNMDHWLRFTASEIYSYDYLFDSIGLGYNYWGTTDIEMINKQILDFDDYQSLYDINEGVVLQTAPETAFPFVTDVKIYNANGDEVSVVGNETIQVVVEFNRDMDMTVPLDVRFGSSLPYAEYQINGFYETARKWIGTYTLTTVIENGNQYFNITNGHVDGDAWFSLQPDLGRFMFEIDTTSAQAMIMQGSASETGITLTWEQDDFDTLAGYNVYRSTSEDGYYQRLNEHVISSDIKTYFDDTVEPGVIYYYNFTVVKTDLTESIPSGKVIIQSLDTMAPNIYHTPVYQAYTNSNLVITATVTDNLMINNATLFYRVVGETTWQKTTMTNNNDKYSAVVTTNYLLVDGLEYYIRAYDGISYTYKGSESDPYKVTIKTAVDANAYGDVNGDGTITVLDALMVLQAINDRLNLTSEEFVRADLDGNGTLEAWEALKILQYVSGKITSIV